MGRLKGDRGYVDSYVGLALSKEVTMYDGGIGLTTTRLTRRAIGESRRILDFFHPTRSERVVSSQTLQCVSSQRGPTLEFIVQLAQILRKWRRCAFEKGVLISL